MCSKSVTPNLGRDEASTLISFLPFIRFSLKQACEQSKTTSYISLILARGGDSNFLEFCVQLIDRTYYYSILFCNLNVLCALRRAYKYFGILKYLKINSKLKNKFFFRSYILSYPILWEP